MSQQIATAPAGGTGPGGALRRRGGSKTRGGSGHSAVRLFEATQPRPSVAQSRGLVAIGLVAWLWCTDAGAQAPEAPRSESTEASGPADPPTDVSQASPKGAAEEAEVSAPAGLSPDVSQASPAVASEEAQASAPAQVSADAAEALAVASDEAAVTAELPEAPPSAPEQWGAVAPGPGLTAAKAQYGELKLSAYLLLRYLNQLPASQRFEDHLGREHPVDTRHDLQLQRLLVWASGFVYAEKLRYEVLFWAANGSARPTLVGSLAYLLNDAFKLYAGVTGLPGTRSMVGPFPYFFGTDRQLAAEFFRPGFTGGIWATGELFDKVGYKAMVGNNLNRIYQEGGPFNRSFAAAASVWVMPTTGEFGPRGGFGDYELHKRVATRFGVSVTSSRESRGDQLAPVSPDNTQIRLSDSSLLFAEGALAPNLTVTRADYNLLAADAGLKIAGVHVQTEYFLRWIRNLRADGPLPVGRMLDHGFDVQVGVQVWPYRMELYAVTSHIFGRFGDSYEVGGGFNVYPLATRNFRLNATGLYVHRSAVSSPFGYYVGGQTGPILSMATDLLF